MRKYKEIVRANLRHVLSFYKEEVSVTTAWWAWNIPFQLASILISLLIYYYYALAFGGYSPLFGENFMTFIIVGLMMNTYLDISMDAYYSAISALYMGKEGIGGLAISRMDYLSLAGISPYVFIFARVSYYYITQTIVFLLYFLAGQFFGVSIPFLKNLGLIVIAMMLGIIACSGIGLISASMYWLAGSYRGVEPIRWTIRMLVPLLSGIFVPLHVLPESIRAISILLPQTHTLQAVRASLAGATFSQILPNLGALIIFSVVLVPVGLLLLKYSLNLERKRGTIY